MKIGVLAVQGAFAEHCKAMENLGLSQSQNRSANLRKHNIHIPHGRFTQKRKRRKPPDGLCY